MIEPTDSSMPPVMMTKAWPMENMPNRPIRLAVLAMLIGRQEARVDDRDHGADHQDQDEQTEVFLVHAHRPSSPLTPLSWRRLPTASCRMLSSLNSLRSRKPLIAPSCITAIAVADADHLLHVAGDHQDGDAGIGQRRASARRSRFLAPTSMPRVGSSKMMTRGLHRSAIWRARPSAGCRRTASRRRVVDRGRADVELRLCCCSAFGLLAPPAARCAACA